MNALVVDPTHTGHHLQYVGVLARGLLDLGAEVTLLLGREAEGSAELATHLAGVAPRVQIDAALAPVADGSLKSWRAAAKEIMERLPRLAGRASCDRVFIPYADGIAQAIEVPPAISGPLKRTPCEGLMMRGNWGYPQTTWSGWFKSRLGKRLALRGPWRTLHLLDPLAYFPLRGTSAVKSGRVRLIPEAVEPLPVVEPRAARQALGLPADGRWLVVTGIQDRRKGSDRLLRAFLAANTPDDARLLLAGKLSCEFSDELHRDARSELQSGKLVVIDRYLSEDEHALALNAADMIAAPQPDAVGSSGLLVRAAALRKPILASNFGWVGWATETFGFGRTVNVTDTAAYAAAIRRMFDDTPPFGNALTERFQQYHRLDNHVAHWLADTRAAMNAPPSRDLHRWDDLFAGTALSVLPSKTTVM
jgi:glycosyltransferase involved in cell wall biosynthesis